MVKVIYSSNIIDNSYLIDFDLLVHKEKEKNSFNIALNVLYLIAFFPMGEILK